MSRDFPKQQIKWLKNGAPVDEDRIQVLFKTGVASLEIFSSRPGEFRATAHKLPNTYASHGLVSQSMVS